MSVCLNYKDAISIIETNINEYASETIKEIHEVKALFSQTTGWSHGSNQDSITSAAHAYVDINNQFILNSLNRLEGMLVISNPLGGDTRDAWYRITNVVVGQDKLLANKVDNIRINLKKSTEIYSVS